MKNMLHLCLIILLLVSCKSQKFQSQIANRTDTISYLSFVDEVVIPSTTTFEDTKVGGLSGLDYAGDAWYAICDDGNTPRFYTMQIDFDGQGFTKQEITHVNFLKNSSGDLFGKGVIDPESIRAISSRELLWSSEGSILKGIDPFISVTTLDGSYVKNIEIADRFLAQGDRAKGPVHNGVFEGICINYDGKGYWAITELPLKEDGLPPTSTEANSPVRLVEIDPNTGRLGREYAYQLDKVARKGSVEVNGVTEVLSYGKDQFLVLERSYASGHEDGGNDVKIYKADISKATEVSQVSSLAKESYIPVKKTLLFDFESIRSKLTEGRVDNIEGMSFGPRFDNGKRSLVLISDDNFNKFGKQITQLILLAVY